MSAQELFGAGAVETLLKALDTDTVGLAWRALAQLVSQMDEGNKAANETPAYSSAAI